MRRYCIILYLMILFFCGITFVASKDVELHKHFDGDGLMLVSTLDGYITAVDAKTGNERWKFKEAPVLESSIEIQHGFTFIPNPKTGHLYYLMEGRLSKLPFTIPELVRVSPCRSTDGILYAGNKKDVWISINPETGERTEAFSAPSPNSYCPVSQANHVFVGKTEYHISMLDTRAKDRRWNATFTDYTSHLLPPDVNYPYKHYTTSSDGWLVTVDALDGSILWKREFHSVIVNMYMLKKDGIHKLPSTAIGRETFGTILEASTKNWKESLLENQEEASNSFQTTLFVGQSTDAGLYALSAYVDSKTPIAPAYVGPPLLEGPSPLKPEYGETDNNDPNSKYQLARTFKEIEGDYLLLGYHQPPSERPNNLVMMPGPTPAARVLLHHIQNSDRHLQIESDSFYDENGNVQFRSCRGGKCHKKQERRRQEVIITNTNNVDYDEDDGNDDDDVNIKRALFSLLRRYPYYVLAVAASIFALIFTVVWMCGRQSALINATNSAHQSWPSDVSQNSSRSRNTASKSWFSSIIHSTGNRLMFNNESMEASEDVKTIGKLSYNRNKKLGQGAGGTTVYEGVFENRKVAVKRVMRENFDSVQREIKLLRDGGGDDHHNVIRYFCSESDNDFGYIALELCEASLDEYIKLPQIRERYPTLSKLSILKQATDGIAYLHSINFVHRDVKPRNILLLTQCQMPKVVISDFGLCKAIQLGHNSVSKTGIVGTEGWIAPEMIKNNSQTCAVDIFSLGCVFHFVLTDGSHPFGDHCRQDRIIQGISDLHKIHKTNMDKGTSVVAEDLIKDMIHEDPTHRPSANAVAAHPLFWSKDRQLQFFLSVSDRIESKRFSKDVEDKATKDQRILKDEAEIIRRLERRSYDVLGAQRWFNQLSDLLQQDLRKFRDYKSNSVQDLLRAMRNKYHHYQELAPELKEQFGDIPDGYITYFTDIFPKLFMHVYAAMTYCAKESVFIKYYPLELCNFYSRKFLEEAQFASPRFRPQKIIKKIDPMTAGGDVGWPRITTSKSTGEIPVGTVVEDKSSSSNWRAKPPSAPTTADVVEPSKATPFNEHGLTNATSAPEMGVADDDEDDDAELRPPEDETVAAVTGQRADAGRDNGAKPKSKGKKKKKKKVAHNKAPLSILAELDADEDDSDEDGIAPADADLPNAENPQQHNTIIPEAD